MSGDGAALASYRLPPARIKGEDVDELPWSGGQDNVEVIAGGESLGCVVLLGIIQTTLGSFPSSNQRPRES